MSRKPGRNETLRQDLEAADDPHFADAIIRAASRGREHRRVPRYAAKSADDRVVIDLEGEQRGLPEILKNAGYREPGALSEFRIADLGADAARVTLRDLDAVHEAVVRVRLEKAGTAPAFAKMLARARVSPYDAIGFIQQCGKDMVLPGDYAVPDGVLIDKEALQRLIDYIKDHRKIDVDLDGGINPPVDPDDFYTDFEDLYTTPNADAVADMLDGRAALHVPLDTNGDGKFAGSTRTHGVGEMLAQAQGFAARGERRVAGQIAVQAAMALDRDRTALERYQAEAVAPAVLASIVLKDSPPLAMRAASRALTAAVPGTRAASESARIAMRAMQRETERMSRASGPSVGPARQAARKLAEEQRVGALAASGLDADARIASTIPTQTFATLLDLTRATAATFALGSRAGEMRSRTDSGLDGRLLPQSPGAYMMGSGGLMTLGDPVIKAHILENWNDLLVDGSFRANFAEYLSTVQGDLFRFDYLLGELRTLLRDIADIEELIFNLAEMVLEQGLGIVADVQDVLSRLIEAINEKVNALADGINGIVDGLVSKLREAAFLNAIINILKNWPHDNWIALFGGIGTNIGAGQSLDAAVMNAMRDMLKADFLAQLDSIADELETLLDDLTTRIRAVALPESLTSKLSDYLTAAGLGTNDIDDAIATLNSAIDSIDLRPRAQGLIDELRNAPDFPDWAVALLVTYVVAPFIAAVIAILPALIAVAIFTPPVLFYISLVVAGSMALDAIPAFVLQALFAFLAVAAAQYIVSIALHLLTGALGLVSNIAREVDQAKARLEALVAALQVDLANLGQLNGLLDAALTEIDAVTGLLPPDVVDTLHDALVGARGVVEDNLHFLLCAAERSFFRETLEFVSVGEMASAPILGADQKVAGLIDERLGSTGAVAAALSTFERTRVERGLAPPQVLTHVLSLRQLIEYQNVFLTDTTQAITGAGRFQQLLNGLPLPFTITANLLDTLVPGLHRALIKDVQLHIDFDLDSVGFAGGPSAAIPVTNPILSEIIGGPLVDPNQPLKDLTADGIGTLTVVDLTNRIGILDDGLEANGADADSAATLAKAIAAGADSLGIAPGAYRTSNEPVGDLVAAGLEALDLGEAVALLNASGANPAGALLAALSAAGVVATARHIDLAEVIDAGLGALAGESVDGMTIEDVVNAGMDALDISGATANLLDAARAIAGDVTDAALDGRIPGGGFPGLPVAAGRIPTGLPAVLTHAGPSRVRLKPSTALVDAYTGQCGVANSSSDLPCALQFTRLIEDTVVDAGDAGWQFLEFCDPPARQMLSHFQILGDGIRFVSPEKQVKPFEYRGLIGDWSLEVPALVNESVQHLLPPIRDIRLVVSAIGHYDADLKGLVAQLPVSLTEPPVPTAPPLPALPVDVPEAPVAAPPLDLTALQQAIEQALAQLNATLSAALADLSGAVTGALSDVSTEIGRVRDGVDSLLDVSEILAAVANQLAAVTGVTDPLSSLKMFTIDSSALSNAAALLAGTSATSGFSVSNNMLTAQGIDPTDVLRVVSVALVPIAAAPLLGNIVWPAGNGSLTAPGTAAQSFNIASGSALLPSAAPSPVGNWNMTLPGGMPLLTDFLVTIFLEIAE